MGERTEADRWRHYMLLGALALGACLAVWVASRYFNFAELQKNYQALAAWRDRHLALSVAAYMATYIAAVAFSVPAEKADRFTANYRYVADDKYELLDAPNESAYTKQPTFLSGAGPSLLVLGSDPGQRLTAAELVAAHSANPWQALMLAVDVKGCQVQVVDEGSASST